MKSFIGRFFAGLNRFWQSIRHFNRFFSRIEKTILLLLAVVAITSLILWAVKMLRTAGYLTASGMVYTEGWVVEDPRATLEFGRLTKSGLTRFGSDGAVTGDLAESWEESADHLTYTFHIRQGISASNLLGYIVQDKEVYNGIAASAPDESTLTLKLQQPLNSFLQVTATPIFPYGPYAIERRTSKVITLVARRDYHLGRLGIGKVVIRLYDSEESLAEAIESGKVLGTADLSWEVDSWSVQRLALPRIVSLFLNIRRAPFNNKDVRQKLIDGANLGDLNLDKVVLVSSTSEEVKVELDDVVKRLQDQGLQIEIVEQNPLEILQNKIANHDFDLLLFGVDYGYSEDLYPFWHSSQAADGGNNFVGLQNKDLDRKLEEARTTEDTNRKQELSAQIRDLIKAQYVEMPIKNETVLYQTSPKVSGNKITKLYDPLDRFGNIIDWAVD